MSSLVKQLQKILKNRIYEIDNKISEQQSSKIIYHTGALEKQKKEDEYILSTIKDLSNQYKDTNSH